MSVRSPVRSVVRDAVRTVIWGESGGSPPAGDPAEFTIVMRTTASPETVVLPMSGSNNLDIDWGDSTTQSGVTANNPSHEYAAAGDYTIKVTGDTNELKFDGSGQENKLIEVVAGGTDFRPTLIANAFRDCVNVEAIDLGGLNMTNYNTLSVTNGQAMFEDCNSAATIVPPDFSVNGPRNALWMFRDCQSVTSLDCSAFDMSAVTVISDMFAECDLLASDPGVVGWDISSVTNAAGLFRDSNNALSTAEYDAILVAWEAQSVQNNVGVHFGDATYTSGSAADTARTALVNDHSWTITDGGAA